ncbi:MAG: hypothetical protein COA43_13795 [Robiginitomaculum sp.]|nr:MAG: hypothetical protein COA43_13795 [Robiginitomaculum sp.]
MASSRTKKTGEVKVARRGRPPLSATQKPKKIIILESALREFSIHGYDGAKISDIAKRAEVVTPAVHYHFKTKDELWKAAMSYSFDQLDASNEISEDSALQDLDEYSLFRVIVRRYIRFSITRPEHARIVFLEGLRETDRSQWLLERFLEPLHLRHRKLFKTLRKKGVIKSYSELTFFSVMGGAVMALVGNLQMVGPLYGIDNVDDKILRKQEDAIIDILFNGFLRRDDEASSRT